MLNGNGHKCKGLCKGYESVFNPTRKRFLKINWCSTCIAEYLKPTLRCLCCGLILRHDIRAKASKADKLLRL